MLRIVIWVLYCHRKLLLSFILYLILRKLQVSAGLFFGELGIISCNCYCVVSDNAWDGESRESDRQYVDL